ncbi:aldehyde dehydrogenase family protein [Paracoccus sp. P2]|uniref:Aldehyde dehydrogenase (NAD+) n=1 Tax=Paracoccus pantotrophus TaxID=82367 RepID=A0A1I5GWU7_PARPN|nr:aldehyde dehydrogenase family protein [Paracoccus pantotrophus]MDF3854552.1 aldehyde dehydrogenase family protein [Paracoccus pantotrophus]QFG38438.1 aldehyde dehydrogenase family protein [Paracoccus pantotrophus]QLH15991.1 aldehyde dehydrogenase family protein [Paracoccus pantotrophus]RDD93987.1 aldehyde dehydrogenase family protein [Paracoccus pantotrophus]RKS51039.1 aldehyde dehydrogenase (NAD+) [Paracoccus pantotrophus]
MKDGNEIQGNLIGGEWLPDGDCRPNVNPSDTRDIIGFFACADRTAVDQAVHAARSAFPAWAAAGPQVRHDLLDAVGTELLARKEEIGRLLAREEGKTLPEAMGETIRAGQVFKFFAGEALRVAGDAQQSVRPGIDVAVTREPVGVIALITPWNFPIAIPAWKIAPALAYGNCVVLKPAELTPGCAHVIAQLLHKHGCPAGVFNLVMGPGSVLGDALVSHPGIDAVSFTGSAATGSRIAATCGTLRRKVQLEMGGKNPMVVMDDADLQNAVQACLNGAFFSTGQRCTASSRLIVQKGIHDAFVERLGREMRALRVGDALQPDTQIGPVVDQRQLDSNLAYVELARSEAAEVLGGERLELDKPGFYQAPALFLNTTNDARINREEIFGPCASVIRVEDFDEALAIANDTEFGLSAGICTGSLKHASEFRRRVEAGMVMVNLPTAGVDYHVPFGGRKGSSFGPREQGRYAAEFYTVVKTAYQLA